jgi:hypothetical protein
MYWNFVLWVPGLQNALHTFEPSLTFSSILEEHLLPLNSKEIVTERRFAMNSPYLPHMRGILYTKELDSFHILYVFCYLFDCGFTCVPDQA